MSSFIAISLILLLQVILDALGDAFRIRNRQQVHHSTEALQVGIWLFLIAAVSPLLGWFDFQWGLILMYLMCRIWLFDIPLNIVAQFGLFYVGKSSLDGRIYWWISGDGNPKRKNIFPVANTAYAIKFLALLVWVAGIINQSVG